MKCIAVLSALLLSSCTAVTNVIAPPYTPQPIRVYDQVQYTIDRAECDAAGQAWVPTFSIGELLSRTVDGAVSSSSMVPINPLVVPAGAAGGVVSSASDGFDIASGQHVNVFRNCLHDETQIDKSAVVADPTPR